MGEASSAELAARNYSDQAGPPGTAESITSEFVRLITLPSGSRWRRTWLLAKCVAQRTQEQIFSGLK
jgi:hypothetical protein